MPAAAVSSSAPSVAAALDPVAELKLRRWGAAEPRARRRPRPAVAPGRLGRDGRPGPGTRRPPGRRERPAARRPPAAARRRARGRPSPAPARRGSPPRRPGSPRRGADRGAGGRFPSTGAVPRRYDPGRRIARAVLSRPVPTPAEPAAPRSPAAHRAAGPDDADAPPVPAADRARGPAAGRAVPQAAPGGADLERRLRGAGRRRSGGANLGLVLPVVNVLAEDGSVRGYVDREVAARPRRTIRLGRETLQRRGRRRPNWRPTPPRRPQRIRR